MLGIKIRTVLLCLLLGAGLAQSGCSVGATGDSGDATETSSYLEQYVDEAGNPILVDPRIDNGPFMIYDEEGPSAEGLRTMTVEQIGEDGFLENPDVYGPHGIGAGTRIMSLWGYLTSEEQSIAYANASPETRELMDEAREELGGMSWEG